MTTANQKLTLADVMESIEDKLEEAEDFLAEMEKTKSDFKAFKHRLSAFLSAADSVTMIMESQGKKYARQMNKSSIFEKWYEGMENKFKVPTGTDRTWMYLRAARNETIHIEQTKPIRLNKVKYTEQLYARSSGSLRSTKPGEVLKESITVLEEPLPPDAGQTSVEIDNTLYSFKRLTIEDHGKLKKLEPPDEDVVTVCKNHIVTLELLIKDCEAILQ